MRRNIIWKLALFLCLFPGVIFGNTPNEKGESDTTPAKKERWDVDNPPGPNRNIEINTRTGTWLSLDIRPDGKELVFDLLGDLYRLPISGGKAAPITSGMSWDMQPKYSPDGQWIAFTSDRGGGDNIWVISSQGGEPRAVTKEKFRLLNSPAWSPDGRFIAARKHFTSRRSLGAGEIWLYRPTGGEGVQLIKKPNDQKDLGEPAFSADGKYLFFSQDITPGSRFEYNKDPNATIYAIKRLEFETGRVETWIKNAGGSVRPTPSPDGKSLAFIRRSRGKTGLYIRNMRSGAETLLSDILDRDMQETWAVHGVYPSFAWTPDNRSIIFWAKGKIYRVDVRTAVASEIAFHVQDTRKVLEPLRFSVKAAPRKFQPNMLRWVHISPNQEMVVFQALGHIYVRSLKNNKTKRLTTQEEYFENYPVVSPDGRWIAYTTWNDKELGSVRLISTVGGRLVKLTDEPGHYVEPAFSPDSKQLLYRKTKGGYLRTPLWSSETGIYLKTIEGGLARRVAYEGRLAHFGARTDRFYFLETIKDDQRVLKSVDLYGGHPRTHLKSQAATDFKVSPDGRWVAFREGFQVYLAPMVSGRTPLKVGPKMKSFPTTRLSNPSAWNLHWSGDSSLIYWSLGATLYAQALDEIVQPPESGKRDTTRPSPKPEEQDLSFTVRADIPSGSIVLRGGQVITMEGSEIIANGMVVISENRIIDVGPVDSVKIPRGAHVIDTTGMTIMPGFIDVHAHARQATEGIVPEQNWENFASLAFGVTTIHDPSNDTQSIFAAKEMAMTGKIISPRIFSTGTILYGAKGHFKANIESLKDAQEHLGRMKRVGATSVKSYNQPRRDQRQQIIEAARGVGIHVVPEGGSLFQHNMTMIVDGHTGVEHAIPVANAYDDVLQLWTGTPVGYTPTLVVAYGGLFGENFWYQESEIWKHPRLSEFVPRNRIDPSARRRMMVPEEEWNHRAVARFCKRFVDAGGKVQIGGHGQREGLAAHWEVWMLAEGGLTPHEALRAATQNGADYLGLSDDLGSITKGKLADLMVVEGDPLKNIRASEDVRYTIVNGRIYDAMTMNEIGNHPRKRSPFYWVPPE